MSEITRIGLRDVSVFKPEQTREKLAELDGDIARARALRDWPQLQEAVIAKINEQAAFVANWDAMVTGNRHNINPSPENAVVGFLSVDEAEGAWLIRQQTVSRWRTSLRDPFAYRDRIMRGSMRAAELIEPQERDYQQPIVPAGRYGTIVVDPPWDMQKIEREVRPNQAGFDYPTMTADELAEPATKWVGESRRISTIRPYSGAKRSGVPCLHAQIRQRCMSSSQPRAPVHHRCEPRQTLAANKIAVNQNCCQIKLPSPSFWATLKSVEKGSAKANIGRILTMWPKAIAPAVSALAVISWSTSVGATLVFEPVISHYRGSGPDDMVFPLYDPTYFNTATNEQVSLARNPGEIDSWSQGYPPEEVMMTFGMYNNTPYNITSLTMTIIGDSTQTLDETGWVVDPNHISARFGDVNGDGKIGLSDIFGTITVSTDFRTLTLSNGVIPAEGHFTDYIFSAIIGDDDLRTEAFAGLEGTFDGVLAPEPSTWTLLIPGVGAMLWARSRRRAPRARH